MKAFPAPRGLTPEERGLLEFLLSQEFPGIEQLRMQSRDVAAVAECECGCGTIDLSIAETAERAKVERSVPVQAGNNECAVLLFVRHGALSSLEIAYFDAPPKNQSPIVVDILC